MVIHYHAFYAKNGTYFGFLSENYNTCRKRCYYEEGSISFKVYSEGTYSNVSSSCLCSIFPVIFESLKCCKNPKSSFSYAPNTISCINCQKE